MSKFKLDFDISTPARRLVPRVVARCPPELPKSRSNSQTSDPESVLAPDAKETDRCDASAPRTPAKENKNDADKKPKKGTRIPVFVVKLVVLGLFLIGSTFLLTPPARVRRSHVLRRHCVTQTHPVPSVVCHNDCRRLGHTECVVEFESTECADRLRSVHFHYADGSTRRVPAMYQRLSNSTMFAIEGDRAVFQPAQCQAQTSAVVVQSASTPSFGRLQSHVVWIAPFTSKSFRVVRNGVHVLAEISAGFVLDRCAPQKSFCVYKLETRCDGHLSTQVIAVDDDGTESHVETFVYCA